jgi:hypothetical protein
MLHLSLEGGADESIIHVRAGRGVTHEIGSNVSFSLDPEMIRFFDPKTETAVQLEA